MDTGRIAVIGSANADLVVQVDRRPGGGETLLGGDLVILPGGKGANQAAAAARCGGDVAFVGCLGADAHGDILAAALDDAGVDTTGLERVDRPTGTAMILLTPDGENSIVVSPGANAELSPECVEQTAPRWSTAAVVVMNLECPMPTVQHVAERASAGGARILLNAAPAAELSTDLLRLCDPLVVNESEAELVSGRHGDPETLARHLLDRGARSVVVTLGARGCLAVTTDEQMSVPAFPVDAVDTTGAGDAFVGALACELARGTTLVDALRFAAATSAVSVRSMGAQASYRDRHEIEAFLEQAASAGE